MQTRQDIINIWFEINRWALKKKKSAERSGISNLRKNEKSSHNIKATVFGKVVQWKMYNYFVFGSQSKIVLKYTVWSNSKLLNSIKKITSFNSLSFVGKTILLLDFLATPGFIGITDKKISTF